MKQVFRSALFVLAIAIAFMLSWCVDVLRDTRDACSGAMRLCKEQMSVAALKVLAVLAPANGPTERTRWREDKATGLNDATSHPAEKRRPTMSPRFRMCPSG